jgi:hypothetical protein
MVKRTKLKAFALLVFIFGQMFVVGWLAERLGAASSLGVAEDAAIPAAKWKIEEFNRMAKLKPEASPQPVAVKDLDITGYGTLPVSLLFFVIPAVTALVAINATAVFAAMRPSEPTTSLDELR